MKKPRKIRSFEPDDSVESMLENAQASGLQLGEIVNGSLRASGPKVIKEMIKRRIKQLESCSFRRPDHRHDQELLAA